MPSLVAHRSLALNAPEHVLVASDGALWIADTGNHRVIGADYHGRVHTIVGCGARPEDAKRAVTATFDQAIFAQPTGLALSADERTLLVTDSRSSLVWQLELSKNAARVVVDMYDGAAALPQGLSQPSQARFGSCACALDDSAATLYLASASTHQIWRLHRPTGALTVLAGDGTRAHRDGRFDRAAFAAPSGLALAPDRKRLYVADAGNAALRVLHLATGEVTTLVGGIQPPEGVRAEQHMLTGCSDVALSPGGLVIVDTQRHAICGVNPRHRSLTPPLWGGREHLARPLAVDFDRAHKRFVIADTGNHRVVRVARDLESADDVTLHR